MSRILHYALAWLVPLVLVAAAFGHGGETLWGQGMIVAAAAAGPIALAIGGGATWPPALRWAALAWGLLVGWCVLQAAPLGIFPHPSWLALGGIATDVPAGAIAIDPQASMDAAVRLGAYAGLCITGWYLSRADRLVSASLVLGIAAVASLGLLAQASEIGPAGLAKVRHWGEPAFPFANRNHFCVFAGIGALVALARLLDPVPAQAWRRGLWAAALMLCLGAAFASHSRAGLAALAAASVASAACMRPSRRVWLASALAGLVLAAALAAGTLARLETLHEAAGLRLSILGEAWRLALAHPITGAGSFDLALQATAPAWREGMVQSAHNIALESLVERGWPATLLAALGLLLVLGQCARSIGLSATASVPAATAIGVATLVLLHGMVDFSVHAPAIAALVAIALGLGAGASPAPAQLPAIGQGRGGPLEGARA